MSLDRIVVVQGVCGGRPIVRGTRLTVSFVLKLLASGLAEAEIVKEYPELEPEDVRQALSYAAWLASEEEHLPAGTIS